MPNSITVTNTFTAGTKAKSAEVNANFQDIIDAMNLGNKDPYFGAIALNSGFTSTAHTLTSTDSLFLLGISCGATLVAAELPNSTANADRIICIMRTDAPSTDATQTGIDVTAASGNSIIAPTNGATQLLKRRGESAWYHTSGDGNWRMIANNYARYPIESVRVETANGHGSTNTKIRHFSGTPVSVGTAISFTSTATDGASATINEDGIYSINYGDNDSTNIRGFGLSVNSNSLTTSINLIDASDRLVQNLSPSGAGASVAISLKLTKGDVIRPHNQGNHNGTAYTYFNICQIVKL